MSIKGFNVNGVVEKYDYNSLDNIPPDGGGLTDTVKQALLNCFKRAEWISDNGETFYNALYAALYPDDPVPSSWGLVRTLTASDLRAGYVFNTVKPYYYKKAANWCYSGFDIRTEYGYDYKFEFTSPYDTAQIQTEWYNDYILEQVANEASFPWIQLNQQPYAATGVVYTPPQTFKNSPVRGVVLNFRYNENSEACPADLISEVKIYRKLSGE